MRKSSEIMFIFISEHLAFLALCLEKTRWNWKSSAFSSLLPCSPFFFMARTLPCLPDSPGAEEDAAISEYSKILHIYTDTRI